MLFIFESVISVGHNRRELQSDSVSWLHVQSVELAP